ncbi:MAG: hypothetical protein ACXAC8_00545 [Candidatus Hodarchaeales archaeon]|jgi:hypothetical protein
MKINAERMRIEEDSDNDLWLVDFRDEKKGLRGKIELPSKIIAMEDVKDFEVEVIPKEKIPASLDYTDSRIAFNATSFRTKSLGTEKTYSFSSGGLMLRLYSGTVIPELKSLLKEYVIIIR